MTWILARLAGLAVPVLAQVAMWAIAIALSASAFAGIQTWRIGELKEGIALAQAQAKAAAASAKATVDLLNKERELADLKTEAAISDALAERPAEVRTVTRTVERIAREDPTFAAAVRPAELAALRVRQLAAVDEANAD